MVHLNKDMLLLQCVHTTKNASFLRHYHVSHELIYIIKGCIEIEVGNKKYTASDNELVFLSNLEEHSTKILSPNYERIFLIINSEALAPLLKHPLLCSIFKNRPKGFFHVCKAPKQTKNLMKSIIYEYERNDDFSNELCACFLKQTLINLHRENKSVFSKTYPNSRIDIFEMQKYLENNFSEDIKISELADKFYISPYYLSHILKKATGYSPKQYLTLIRLTHAKEFLLESDLSVEAIAQNCGFADSNSLIRCFKQEYNITPKQFRLNYRVLK